MSTPSDVAGPSLAAADGSAASLNPSLEGPLTRKSGNRRERPLVAEGVGKHKTKFAEFDSDESWSSRLPRIEPQSSRLRVFVQSK
jgi:hypothetical protein